MQSQIASATRQAKHSLALTRPLQHVGAALLGVIILYGAGFVNTAVVHSAAHDTRHSQGFPCH